MLEIETSEPGLQFHSGHSGNLLDGTLVGSDGGTLRQGDGECLETQHAPDSPKGARMAWHHAAPGEELRSGTVHRFCISAG